MIAPMARYFSPVRTIANRALPRTPSTLMSVRTNRAAQVSSGAFQFNPVSAWKCFENTVAIPPAAAGLVISM
jgi:hypothetical protein